MLSFIKNHKGKELFVIWAPLLIATLVVMGLVHRVNCKGPTCLLIIRSDSLLNFSKIHLVQHSIVSVDSVLYISLFAVMLIILIGTGLFLREIVNNAVVSGSSVALKQYKWALWLTAGSLVVTVVWMVGLFASDEVLNDLVRRHTEHIALFIFSLFIVVDCLFFNSAKKELEVSDPATSDEASLAKNDNRRKTLSSLKQLSWESIWFIDVPVVVGVGITIALSLYLDSQGDLHGYTKYARETLGLNDSDQDKVFETYLHGFSTGAVIMHLAMSQFIFGVLKMRDLYRRT